MPKRSIGRRLRPKKEVIRKNNVVVKNQRQRAVGSHLKEKLPNISVQREFHCPEVIAVIILTATRFIPNCTLNVRLGENPLYGLCSRILGTRLKWRKKFPLSLCAKKVVKDTCLLYVRKIYIRFQKYNLNLWK